MGYVLVACQVLLLAVFGASAAAKIRSGAAWSGFVGSVRDLRLVPKRMVRLAAAGAVAGETVVVLLLVVPLSVPAGLVLAGGLLGVFTTSIVVTVRRRIAAVCRCFGPTSGLPLGWRHVVRNGLLLAVVVLAGVSWLLPRGVPEPAGLVLAGLAGLAGAVVFVFFDEIVELFAGAPVGAGLRERGRA